MPVDLNNMAAQIQTVLAGVSGIVAAFDYEPQNMPQLPAATLFFDGFTENEETIGRLQYDWNWKIRIYVSLNAAGSDIHVPQVTIRQLTTDSLKALRANLQLNGTCMYNSVSSGDVITILDQNNPMIVSELTMKATTQESR
jgi:hypothetical protein